MESTIVKGPVLHAKGEDTRSVEFLKGGKRGDALLTSLAKCNLGGIS
jgi:hypothetical protein